MVNLTWFHRRFLVGLGREGAVEAPREERRVRVGKQKKRAKEQGDSERLAAKGLLILSFHGFWTN